MKDFDLNSTFVRYELVYLVYYSPWKWSMLEKALDRYDFERPGIIRVDLMQTIRRNGYDLDIDGKPKINHNNRPWEKLLKFRSTHFDLSPITGYSMDNIINTFDDYYTASQQDALINALALRRCAINAANKCHENVKSFLGIDKY